MPIPKILHLIWIGDESKRPNANIESWRFMNPSYSVKLWGNQDLLSIRWKSMPQIKAWLLREINGAADVMRWEILYRFGGVAVDADSKCVRSLEDWLLEPECFAVWENEIARPGLIACGALGAVPQHPLVGQILTDILADNDLTTKMAWETVGPGRITKTVQSHRFPNLTVYPSHYFIPRHFTGVQYAGTGPVFASQDWGSTFQSYGQMPGNSFTTAPRANARSLDQMLQEASLALAEGNTLQAAELAAEILKRDADSKLASQILLAAAETEDEPRQRPIISRSAGNSFFLQRMQIEETTPNRMEVFLPLIARKKVLHVGCVDSPIFNPYSNLHLVLSKSAGELHGLDTDLAGLNKLREYFDSVYFADVDRCLEHGTKYDIVLIPETIEHVANPESFLKSIDRIPFETILITAPCVLGWSQYGVMSYSQRDTSYGRYGWLLNSGSFVEEVHPDHKFWFSPYTLANLVETATSWKIEKVLLLEEARQVAIVARHRDRNCFCGTPLIEQSCDPLPNRPQVLFSE